MEQQPNEILINHKLNELLINIFTSNQYLDLKNYFISLCQDKVYHMTRVREENFAYNLKLEDFSRPEGRHPDRGSLHPSIYGDLSALFNCQL